MFSDEDDNENSFTLITHNNDDINVIKSIKQSFNNIAINNDFLRTSYFAHTLELVVNDRLKQSSSIQSVLLKVSKIVKLSHTNVVTFAEKLEYIGESIPKASKIRWNGQFNTIEKALWMPSDNLNEILVSIKRKNPCLFG